MNSKTKKIMIIVGLVMFYFLSMFAIAVLSYDIGYEQAMLDIEEQVLAGIKSLGDFFNGGSLD